MAAICRIVVTWPIEMSNVSAMTSCEPPRNSTATNVIAAAPAAVRCGPVARPVEEVVLAVVAG